MKTLSGKCPQCKLSGRTSITSVKSPEPHYWTDCLHCGRSGERSTSLDVTLAMWRRNQAFMNLDLEWAARMVPNRGYSHRDFQLILLVSLHKARYECLDIPDAERTASRAFLEDRGYTHRGGLPWPSKGLPV